MAGNPLWHETLHDYSGQHFSIDNMLYHEKTDHQDLIIFDNCASGRVMALDSVVQTTERDEFIYYEMMTHVPLLVHGNARHVLIIDGGDGAMLCEVSRHRSIETTTMVEIDAGAVSFCRQYLSNHSAGAYDDLRFALVIDNDVNFVNQATQTFDVIVSDYTGPTGPGESLFTSAFYEGYKCCLSPGDVFVTQDGACFPQQDETVGSHRKLSHYFRDVSFYQTATPTYYGRIMTFIWTGDNKALRHPSSEIIQARFHKANLICHCYSLTIHMAASALPQCLHDASSAP